MCMYSYIYLHICMYMFVHIFSYFTALRSFQNTVVIFWPLIILTVHFQAIKYSLKTHFLSDYKITVLFQALTLSAVH